MAQMPTFIAFTGVDRVENIEALQALSARYPVEWGMLIDDDQIEKPLFPDAAARRAFLTAGGMRFAAHVCGKEARKIANTPNNVAVDLTGFQRIQVNHSSTGSTADQIENTLRFGRTLGVRTMLQCKGTFPEEARLDWLFDTSFGTGVAPSFWPSLPQTGPFCGYSGGINPHNVNEIVRKINAPEGAQYWIDMESGIRTDGWLDLSKCEAVCRAVYG